jgi:pullulanase/glycogen debranching enzyme
MDSLRHWVEHMQVDGFRFDLATTLGRTAKGFDRNHPFLQAVRQDPVLSRVKLIAEPWDVGPGATSSGPFPALPRMERQVPGPGAPLLAGRPGHDPQACHANLGLGAQVRP